MRVVCERVRLSEYDRKKNRQSELDDKPPARASRGFLRNIVQLRQARRLLVFYAAAAPFMASRLAGKVYPL